MQHLKCAGGVVEADGGIRDVEIARRAWGYEPYLFAAGGKADPRTSCRLSATQKPAAWWLRMPKQGVAEVCRTATAFKASYYTPVPVPAPLPLAACEAACGPGLAAVASSCIATTLQAQCLRSDDKE